MVVVGHESAGGRFHLTSADLIAPWQWFREDPNLTVLRHHGCVSTALALHRLGLDDLAQRFAAWVVRDFEATPLEELLHVLATAGINVPQEVPAEDLDTLIDELFAMADQIDSRPNT